MYAIAKLQQTMEVGNCILFHRIDIDIDLFLLAGMIHGKLNTNFIIILFTILPIHKVCAFLYRMFAKFINHPRVAVAAANFVINLLFGFHGQWQILGIQMDIHIHTYSHMCSFLYMYKFEVQS